MGICSFYKPTKTFIKPSIDEELENYLQCE